VSFEVALNLTFSEYVKKSDPSTKYIKKYIGNEENDLNRVAYYLARYLKDKQNSQNLVLDFDETKFKKEDQFEFFDSITGAQSIKSLSVAKINLVNVNAIMKLENLEALDISGTKISETDLKLLSRLSKLKKLAVRDLDIKDLANITRYLPNLEELDISENKRIVNISTLKDMENLRVLKVSNIGLTSLEPIELLTQLNSLDLSKNDLSNMDKSQYTILANLYNLAHLNTSFTKISDEFLNNYFDVTSAQRLLTFINRNHFNRLQIGNCQYNNFEEISNLEKLVNLEYLDIYGNSCQVQKSVFKGLLTTTPFKYMYNLKTLNIANNIISDLNGIKLLDLGKLVLNELNTKDSVYLKETGIHVTREACVNILGLYQRACSTLSSGKFVTIKFAAGHNEWTVPSNVFKVRLLGASGANGGSGGGGSGAANSCHAGNWGCYTRGGNGGNGGKANGLLIINNGQQGKAKDHGGGYHTEPSGTNGKDGEVGGVTNFKNITFSQAAEYIKDGFYPRNRIRKGGTEGKGGEARKGNFGDRSEVISGGAGGAGINGWNSLVEVYESDVIPGEKIKFLVGKGGIGGRKGVAGITPGSERLRWSNNGLDGTDGTDGEHGFLEITYEIYQ
jgi:Leucine-rich repeat (LRR) protein